MVVEAIISPIIANNNNAFFKSFSKIEPPSLRKMIFERNDSFYDYSFATIFEFTLYINEKQK